MSPSIAAECAINDRAVEMIRAEKILQRAREMFRTFHRVTSPGYSDEYLTELERRVFDDPDILPARSSWCDIAERETQREGGAA